MVIIAVNGSPRKKGNSAAMLKSWLDGAGEKHPEAMIQWVNLYDLAFKGCHSCFACKRKNGRLYGKCPIKDDIHDLIPAVYAADAVGIACPIYFGELDAYTRCFLERAIFCKTTLGIIKNHDVAVLTQLALGAYYAKGRDGRFREVEIDYMAKDQIHDMIGMFVAAGQRAAAAGFDGVQIHQILPRGYLCFQAEEETRPLLFPD